MASVRLLSCVLLMVAAVAVSVSAAPPTHGDGCQSNVECPPDRVCHKRRCINPCDLDVCGTEAECGTDGKHRAICRCPQNYTGDPLVACVRRECDVNSECPPDQACHNYRCLNPCDLDVCGTEAECGTDGTHRAICRCPQNYTGDPLVACARRECDVDSECPPDQACHSYRCLKPCDVGLCGLGVVCEVRRGLDFCRCPPDHVGDPLIACTPREERI